MRSIVEIRVETGSGQFTCAGKIGHFSLGHAGHWVKHKSFIECTKVVSFNTRLLRITLDYCIAAWHKFGGLVGSSLVEQSLLTSVAKLDKFQAKFYII